MIHRHGATPLGLGWLSVQRMRDCFADLLRLLAGDESPGRSIADLGCGYGALFDHVRSLPALRQGRYIGYDITAAMLEAARQRILDPRACFIQSDRPLEEVDYSFVSGTYNLALGADPVDWTRYIEASLEQLATTSRRGFAFNMLNRPARLDPDMYYGDPDLWLSRCQALYSTSARLIQGRDGVHWTLLVPLV